MTQSLKGLYLITRALPGGADELAEAVRQAVRGGASLVQYRDKGHDHARRRTEVESLLAMCRRHGVPLIVNDDVALAGESAADGVHLGAGDADIAAARKYLGERTLIGASCYDSMERALRAQASGADYVAFGSFFPSPTKPEAARADPALLEEAGSRLALPICAIGGITPDNGGMLVRSGADMLAVLSGVFDAPDREAAAARYARLFHPQDESEEG